MPVKMTEEEFRDMQKKSAQLKGGGPAPRQAGKMQAWKSRRVKASEPGYTESKTRRIARKVGAAVVKAGGAAVRGAHRYFEEEARSQRTAGEITRAGVESHRGTWINPGSSYPRKKSGGSSNDMYYIGVPSSAGGFGGGVGSGTGFGGLMSTLPGRSIAQKKKKKATKKRKRRY